MVTRSPRERSRRPRLEAVSPLPSEEATPPVTKTCLVGCGATKRAPRGLEWRPSGGQSQADRAVSTGFEPTNDFGPYVPRGEFTACPAWCLRRPRRLSHVEQLLGVRHRGVGLLETGEHPGELLHPAGVVEDVEARGGDGPVAGLAYDDVAVGERRHLGQVGHDEDLGRPGQRGEPAADLDRRLAADPGVDLVEDERGHRPGVGQRDLDGQHHPGQLAARGTLGQRTRLGAGVGGQHQLDLVDPGGGEPPGPAVDLEAAGRPPTRSRRTPNRACGIDSECSSSVTPWPRAARRPPAGAG